MPRETPGALDHAQGCGKALWGLILDGPERPGTTGCRALSRTGFAHVPRYTYRRLSKLPGTDETLRRWVELNVPGGLPGVAVRRTVMQPGADIPVTTDDVGQLFLTISGRGVLLLDGDRIEVSANEVVFVPPGCPCGLQTLGGTDWVYLLVLSSG
jgi:quercetin dioxygenase-like cupin family protein